MNLDLLRIKPYTFLIIIGLQKYFVFSRYAKEAGKTF